jgi:hypothetical protein
MYVGINHRLWEQILGCGNKSVVYLNIVRQREHKSIGVKENKNTSIF